MRIHKLTFRIASCYRLILATAVASFTMGSVQSDEVKRIVTDKKVNSISAAMESSLEDLPKLYETVSESIVRVETTDHFNVAGVIVSSDGHILVGNGFAYMNGVDS